MSHVLAYLDGDMTSFGDVESNHTSEDFTFTNRYVLDSITFTVNNQNHIIKPANLLVQWVSAVRVATYTYNIFPSTEPDNQIPYSFSISSKD